MERSDSEIFTQMSRELLELQSGLVDNNITPRISAVIQNLDELPEVTEIATESRKLVEIMLSLQTVCGRLSDTVEELERKHNLRDDEPDLGEAGEDIVL